MPTIVEYALLAGTTGAAKIETIPQSLAARLTRELGEATGRMISGQSWDTEGAGGEGGGAVAVADAAALGAAVGGLMGDPAAAEVAHVGDRLDNDVRPSAQASRSRW